MSRLYNILNKLVVGSTPSITWAASISLGGYGYHQRLGNIAVGNINIMADSSPAENKVIASGFPKPKNRTYFMAYDAIAGKVIRAYIDTDGQLKWAAQYTSNVFNMPYAYAIDE